MNLSNFRMLKNLIISNFFSLYIMKDEIYIKMMNYIINEAFCVYYKVYN